MLTAAAQAKAVLTDGQRARVTMHMEHGEHH